ncbi:MAG TPA: prolipoprotein diacylglyceryl transferase family protein [Patescibacteria group bacterium]|nr:prolipoprotein diacylglyceryl transferase family protein [Patescibacteria group bacterium]
MIAIIILACLVFLFCIYELAKDDFVLLRKKISPEQIFNTLLIALPVSIFFARVIYAALQMPRLFLRPLAFFAIPYVPGLSLGGGIAGVLLFFCFVATRKKLPVERILDIITPAFFTSWAVYTFFLLLFYAVLHNPLGIAAGSAFLLTVIGAIAFFMLFSKGKWIDGTISYIGLMYFAVITLLVYLVNSLVFDKFTFQWEAIIASAVGFVGLILSGKKLLRRKLFTKKTL